MALLTEAQRRVAAATGNRNTLWTGSPAPGLRMRQGDWLQTLIGIPFTAFAIFWTVMASRGGAPFFFMLWGGMFIAFGLYTLAGRYFWDAYIRSRQTYAVSEDGSAFVIDSNGKVKRLYLPSVSNMRLEDNGGGIGTIMFGDGSLSRSPFTNSNGSRPMAFEFIPNAATVFDICSQFQKR